MTISELKHLAFLSALVVLFLLVFLAGKIFLCLSLPFMC